MNRHAFWSFQVSLIMTPFIPEDCHQHHEKACRDPLDYDPPDSRNHMAKPYDEALIQAYHNSPVLAWLRRANL